jgi:hypothetical protein
LHCLWAFERQRPTCQLAFASGLDRDLDAFLCPSQNVGGHETPFPTAGNFLLFQCFVCPAKLVGGKAVAVVEAWQQRDMI